jgi:hypothetical protein
VILVRNSNLVECLALTEGDLAKGAAEAAGEVESDHLVDDQRPIGPDLDDDVRGGQRERLRSGVPGERESREYGDR